MQEAHLDESPRETTLVEDLSFSRIRERSKIGSVTFSLSDAFSIRAVGAIYGIEFEVKEKTFEARVHLDSYNQRLLLLGHTSHSYVNLVKHLEALASQNNLDKVIYYAREHELDHFLEQGFIRESHLHNFYNGSDAFFLSKFLTESRMRSRAQGDEDQLLKTIVTKKAKPSAADRYKNFNFRIAQTKDISPILQIYRKVFDTYPSPLTYQDYFESLFQKKSIFYVATKGTGSQEHVVAVASAELNVQAKAAELTDCATLPSFRGNGLMARILECLEKELISRDFVCAYTMARARSYGMNLTFSKLGYLYRGRMVNNCDIQGAFEDMNVWEKRLPSASRM